MSSSLTEADGGAGDGKLVFAVPSKGRLMEDTLALLAKSGLTLRKSGHARGYHGEIAEIPEADVLFVSASEIASHLKYGRIHLGVTGEDLVRETMPDADRHVRLLKPMGFGHADVVVAVPNFWIDVATMAGLEAMSLRFRRLHGRPLRVATKYMTLSRGFFARHGVLEYRLVESLGATEGAPAAGTADLIVDITSTGETLHANALRILDDGIILKSQAQLIEAKGAPWSPGALAARAEIGRRLGLDQAGHS